jgi:NitT/TauT family transport system permease protein/sulfonate transport system permease protein
LWAAKSLRLGEATTFLQVILPAALPLIVSGVRSGVAISFVMVFVSELAGASAGIGYAINTYQLAYRTDFMMAYLVVLGALGATCDQLVSRLIRSVFPWLGFIES